MANGIRNALLFGGGALVAAVAVAYGLGAFAPTPTDKVAETGAPTENSMAAKEARVPAAPQENAAAEKPAAASSVPAKPAELTRKGDTAAAGSAAAPGNAISGGDAGSGDNAAAKPETAKADDGAGVMTPSFDVVRVEGNGSIVVAGRSAPGAKVEILSGKNVLGASTAGAEGDFAIVLDDPLKPGDYQLVLRSTTPAKVVAMSKETAVVSIPEHENGQVLALVESPGQPSKLITVPQPGKTAAAAPAPAIPGAAQSGTSQAAGAPTVPPAGAQTASGGTSAPAPAGAQGGAEALNPANASVPGAETARAAIPATGRSSQLPAASGQAQASASQSDAGQASAAPAVQSKVSVEAVEIEGNKIFVAGVADPGSTVRVYANDTVLGEAKTSPVGRFLVESIHELAVGDYIIRADMLAADGLKVAARAAVPFTRAPGESVAAVASGEAGSAAAEKGAVGAPAKSTADSSDAAGMPATAGPAGTAASGDMANAAGKPSAGGTAPTEAQGNGASQVVASSGGGATVLPPPDSDISRQPPTVVSPKLQETSGAVIIRRGDTLWQISRRVYGHGIRYSTIYLANQDQIEDPDLIWPGQIFAVPHETKEGETANMKAIASQATEVAKKALE
jgi:nucleoid-associated protein YgaU